MIRPTPVTFDFEHDAEPPDWLVDGVIERGTVMVLSGDTAAGKSLIADALTVAVLQGAEWLGREAQQGRVLYVDEENHRRLVRDRLKAFGLSNDERDGLRYFLRAGVALGDTAWNSWLAAETQEHRADLVIIDTASSTTSHDVNDNSKVAQLFRDALRPATLSGAAVLVLHHERKTTGEWPRNASQAMLGARQWAGQADGHLAVRAAGCPSRTFGVSSSTGNRWRESSGSFERAPMATRTACDHQ
jgi:RecA-family ATPase